MDAGQGMSGGCLAIETLIDFVDGRAEPPLRSIVQRHTGRCDTCREALSLLERSATPAPAGPSRRPAPVASVLAAGAQVGRYIIDREVGAGGMGAVYAAHDPELGRMVAVKVLRRWGDQRMQERLRREAQAMARLAHPNVAAVYDVGAFGDQIFIAMEYVDGETLSRWLATPRPPAEVLEVFRAAGRGLAAAHAAGIVHRDFKPENVLIGNDGRVCVGDFGLARAAGVRERSLPVRPAFDPTSTSTEPADADAPIVAELMGAQSGLTVRGALVGTPYYMAPELYDGAPADERSDQFSFCIAVLTALHGKRPSDIAALDAVARATQLRELVGSLRLPRRVRAALSRGVLADPAARFASVDALLAELAPRDRSVRWIAAIGAAVIAAVVAVVWWGSHRLAEPDQRCTGAAAAYALTWSPARRAAISAAFTATGAPFAAAALHQALATLDQYAQRWTESHTATCRATRILGEQTESMLDLRMTCLERRRQEAAALIDTLAMADIAAVTHAVEATAGLTDVATCAHITELLQVISPPRDAATRDRLAALAPRFAAAHAKLDTGAYAAGLALARPLAAEARALGYRPFEAEAEYLQGVLEVQVGDAAHAEPTLEAAMLAAEAGRHDEIAARARIAMVSLIGQDKADYARAIALAPFAAAAIVRVGGSADLELELEQVLGGIAFRKSKLDVAVPHFTKALALAERVHGPDHPAAARAAHGLGMATLAQGHPARAVALFERALAIFERLLGPEHPLVARELHALGNAHVDDGHIELAVQDLRRALAIREIALGPDHPHVANNLSDLARALRAEHHDEEALAFDRRAVAVGARVVGPDHPSYADQLAGLGNTLAHMGRYAEAAEQLHHAEAIFTKVYGPHHDSVVKVHSALAGMVFAQSHWREAITVYERLIPELENAQDIGEWLPVARINLACAALELHQPARALAALAPITSHMDAVSPRLRGYTRYVVARATWDSGGDRTRVQALLDIGRAELAAAGPEAVPDLADVDAWVKRHPELRPPGAVSLDR